MYLLPLEILNSNLFKLDKYVAAPVKDCKKKANEIIEENRRSGFIKLVDLFYPK